MRHASPRPPLELVSPPSLGPSEQLVKRVLVVAALGTGLVLSAGAVAVVSRTQDPSRTAKGTTIAGIRAGDLDDAELRALLAERVRQGPSRVTVRLGTASVVLLPSELGVMVDVAATAERALASSARRLPGFGSSHGGDVTPVVTASGDLRSTAVRVVAAADVPESHGELVASSGGIALRPPGPGQGTTLRAVEQALRQALERLPLPARIDVAVTERPAHVSVAAVQSLAAQANAVAGAPTTLRAGARTATIAGSDLARHLRVTAQGSGAGHGVVLGLDEAVTRAVAAPIAAQLSTPPLEPVVAAPAPVATLTTQGSVLWQPRPAATRLVAGGRNGQAVSAQAVLAAVLANVRAAVPASNLTVPPVTTVPKTTDAAARQVRALLGTFTTPFRCCQPRVTNIALMARTVDGTLIAPGQTFSLNGIVGRRTKQKGYVEAPFILDGELSTDIGGGVSQFATTTLNAALFAGLRLDRHQAHSFYISRYPAGREATVNYPSIDLAWTNTTAAPILVRAATGPRSLTVALYGLSDGRTVEAISGPRRAVTGRAFRITVTRVVRVPGRPAQRESFTTTYNKPPEGE